MLTWKTFLFTGTALGSSCRERKGHAHSHPHTWERPSAVLSATEQLHWSGRCALLKGTWEDLTEFSGHQDILSIFCFSFYFQPVFLFLYPSSQSLHICLSLCLTHLSLTVTHQDCVSEDSEYVRVLSGHSGFFFFFFNSPSSVKVSLCLLPPLPPSPATVNNWLCLWVIPSFFFSLD